MQPSPSFPPHLPLLSATDLPDRAGILAAIHCPFPLRINVHAGAAEERSLRWLERHGIVARGPRLKALAGAHLTTLVAGFYPSAGLPQLCLASDYVCWAFALDDLGDETEVGLRPARLAELFGSFAALLDGAAPRTGATPLDRGLHELLVRVAALTTPAQMTAFVAGNRAYFDAMLWEADNRARRKVPGEAAYLALRPAAGAVPSFFALIEPLEEIRLAPAVRSHPAVVRLAGLAGDIICWTNDLLSYEKEHAHGDFHNLVMVLQHHRDLKPADAAESAIELVNGATHDFIDIAARLPSFDEDQDRELARYVEVLRAVIRITLHWTAASTRYGSAPKPTGALSRVAPHSCGE
jgi:hypothetical protein